MLRISLSLLISSMLVCQIGLLCMLCLGKDASELAPRWMRFTILGVIIAVCVNAILITLNHGFQLNL